MQAAGPAAQAIADIGWVLFAGGAAIFMGVMLLLAWSLRRRPDAVRPMLWVIGGGVLFPGVVLAALMAWSLPMAPEWKPVPPPGALVIGVTGRMWWWEVRYRDPSTGREIHTANEIHIPTGQPVYLAVASADVIHSFWVPQLGGKMDMVPGRMQHLLLSAERPGVYRGQCAEYCGEQHAHMALHVVAQPPEAFAAWLAAQAQPAAAALPTARQSQGRSAFAAQRCEACHSVRGVTGDSRLGPDLTHVGSRLYLGAGTLPNTVQGRVDWMARVQQLKPGARMPSFGHLDAETRTAIADWLGSLK